MKVNGIELPAYDEDMPIVLKNVIVKHGSGETGIEVFEGETVHIEDCLFSAKRVWLCGK